MSIATRSSFSAQARKCSELCLAALRTFTRIGIRARITSVRFGVGMKRPGRIHSISIRTSTIAIAVERGIIVRTFLRDKKMRLLIASLGAVFLGVAIPMAVASVSDGFPTPADVQGEPIATGPIVTVATGRLAGQQWKLVANDSDQGLCVHLELTSPQRGRSGGCGASLTSGGVGLFTATVATGATWIFGPVGTRASTVEVRLPDGTSVPTRAVGGRGFGTNFYVATRATPTTPTAVVARGASGSVVGRQDVG